MKMLYYDIVLFSAFVFFTDKDRCKGMATERKIHSIECFCLIYLYPDSSSQNTFVFFFTLKVKLKAFWHYVWMVTHVFFCAPWNEKPRKMAREEGFPSVATID